MREPVGGAGARDAEVGDLHAARSCEQHVAGFDVAVHDTGTMRETERRRDLGSDLRGLVGVERALAADEVPQRPTFDVLHDDEVRAGFLTPVVDADDVRVVQVRCRLRLPPEALDERRFARVLGEECLQRDRTIEQAIVTEVDLGHTALREFTLNLIPVREDPSDQRHSQFTLSIGA